MFFDYNFSFLDGIADFSADIVENDQKPVNSFQEGVFLTGSNSSTTQYLQGSISTNQSSTDF